LTVATESSPRDEELNSVDQESSVLNQTIHDVSPKKPDGTSLENQNDEPSVSNSPQSQSPNSPTRSNSLTETQKIISTPERAEVLLPVIKLEPSVPVLSKQQQLLFEQQMRQHVQLTTTHFLQCYKHPTHYKLATEMKNLLVNMIST